VVESQPSKLLVAGSIPASRSKLFLCMKASDMFLQAVLPLNDEAHFAVVKASLEPLFASGNVAGYLKRVKRSKLRVRDFEGLLQRGLLGAATAEAYRALGDSDRGQARELYLSLVEQVAPELRTRFLKVYAYY